MAQEQYKRHNFFIKKWFQTKYTLSIALTLLLVMLVSGAGLYLGMWASIIENFSEFKVSQDLETAKRIRGYEDVRYERGDYRLDKIFREAELLSEQQRETLKNALKAVNKSLLPKILVLIALIFIGGIFLSHKIAGPMYRFEQSAEAVKDGDLTVYFKVRKNDEMKKAASFLEEMVENLRTDIERIKVAKNKLESAPGDKKRLAEVIKEIDNVLSKYKT